MKAALLVPWVDFNELQYCFKVLRKMKCKVWLWWGDADLLNHFTWKELEPFRVSRAGRVMNFIGLSPWREFSLVIPAAKDIHSEQHGSTTCVWKTALV